jgi:deoxyribonuclease V
MKIHTLHTWDLTPDQAIALQTQLASRIDTSTPLDKCDLIAGADVAYDDVTHTVYAGVVVLRTSDWTVIEKQGVIGKNEFPYQPGLLSFREAPVLLEAFARIENEPHLVMFDGQGTAHPRRFGLACHAGLWLERPSLGCAKSRFRGNYRGLGREAGSSVDMIEQGQVIGRAVRTRTDVKEVFVSVGHKIDLESAVRWVLAGSREARVPEPTRQADIFVNALRANLLGQQQTSQTE